MYVIITVLICLSHPYKKHDRLIQQSQLTGVVLKNDILIYYVYLLSDEKKVLKL